MSYLFLTGTIIFAPWTLYSVSYLHNYMSFTLSPPSSLSDIELIMVLPCFWCSSAGICSLWHEESVVLIAVTEQNCSHFLLFSLKLQKSETSEILSDVLVPFMITFLIILINGMSFEVCPWNLILLWICWLSAVYHYIYAHFLQVLLIHFNLF